MSLKCSEIITYKKKCQTEELTLGAGKGMYNFLKTRNSCFYENFIPKIG